PESFLTCPITLDTPENGVFMRKDECHFDSKKEAFVASDA
ncbi:T3SS effector NleG family protein, partial [Escherichia coli]|nr:T3SS effector NleG family protein [Escherichia coli]